MATPLQLPPHKGIVCLFKPHRRGRAMTWQKRGLIRQGVDLLADVLQQQGVVGTLEIGPADAALENCIPYNSHL